MYSGVNIHRAPGKSLDVEFLKKCAGEKADTVGATFAMNGKLVHAVSGLDKLDNWVKTLTDPKYKDISMFIHLGNEDAGEVPNASQQPFVLLRKDDKTPILCCIMDGDFAEFMEPEATNTPEFQAVQTYLLPRIGELFTACGEDIPKLIGDLKSVVRQREIRGALGSERYSILLLANTGDYVHLIKNPEHANFDWGWASQSFGYTKGLLANKDTGASDKTVAEPAKEDGDMFGNPLPDADPVKPSVQAVPGTGPQPVVTDPATTTPKDIYVTMPASIIKGSNTSKKRWCSQYLGTVPSDWSEKTGPQRSKLKASLVDNAQALVDKGDIVLLKPPKSGSVPAVGKTPDIPELAPVIIDADDRKRIENVFSPVILGQTDDSGQYIQPPDKIVAALGTLPTVTERLGWETMGGLDVFDRFTDLALMTFVTTSKAGTVEVLKQFRAERRRDKAALAAATGINQKTGKAA